MSPETQKAEKPIHQIRKFLITVVLILFVVTIPVYFFLTAHKVADPANTDAWRQYNNHEKGFDVTFLGKPDKSNEGTGTLSSTVFNSTSKDDANSYNVTAADVTSNVSSGSQLLVTEYFKLRKKGLQNLVVKETKTDVNQGFSYTETTFSGTTGGINKTYVVRAGFANNKLYGVYTVGNDGEAINSDFFLDSFKPV